MADHPPIGARIEIPVHYDMWMRGAKFGTVTQYREPTSRSAFVYVRMDHPSIKRRLKLWALDWEYIKYL